MCGIVGVTGQCDPSLIERMLNAVASRGPDGTRIHSEGNTHFGFARLAINDLTKTGSQPMVSSNNRFISMMNGEIYNAPELRRLLEAKGHVFEGTSDAEIIPNGYVEWGEELFPMLRGMFAIAITDRITKTLLLVRDQFGIKPLYYATTDDGVVFSSSARAVSLHPAVGQSLNHSALAQVLRFRYVGNGEPLYRKHPR